MNAGIRTVCALIGVVVSGPLVTAGQAPPSPGPPRPFALPSPATLTLENGTRVTLIDFGVVPKATIAVVVRAGQLNAGDKVWLPGMTGELLKEGTDTRSAEQISTAAAVMGGDLSITVNDNETSLSLDVLSEHSADAIALLADILRHPQLPESELPRIRQNYLRNLSVALTQPQTLANAGFAAHMYPDHPYGRSLPTPELLQSYTIRDIRGFYEVNFGARRTHVYVAGKFDRALVEEAIRANLGDWRAGPEPLVIPPPPGHEHVVELIDRPGAPQSTLQVGLRVIDPPHPDFMPLSVANTLLGGALTSRITMNLRETRGWVYSPVSSLDTKLRTATWSENADVRTVATGPALAEIFAEIDRLRREPPTEPELTDMKNYRNGIFVLSTATRGGLIGQLAFMNLHGLPPDWLTTFVTRMYAVTPEQTMQVTRQHLDPAKMSLVVVGDIANVRKQIDMVEALRDASIVVDGTQPGN